MTERKDGFVNELQLWHGTSIANIFQICEQSLDPRLTKRAAYGKGVYFSLFPQLAADSYTVPDVYGIRNVILADVMLGYYTLVRLHLIFFNSIM